MRNQEEFGMLVLSRKQGQRIVVCNGITVTVVSVRGSRVKLGFDGPAEIPIHREEVQHRLATAPAELDVSGQPASFAPA
jgi:carbon storage regulator